MLTRALPFVRLILLREERLAHTFHSGALIIHLFLYSLLAAGLTDFNMSSP
jgi:hypothetical protein